MEPLKDLKDFTVFVEGNREAGKVKTFKHPDLDEMIDSVQLGGSMGKTAIPMGLDELTAEIEMRGVNDTLMRKFAAADTLIVIRAVARDLNDVVSPVKVTLRGRVSKLESGEWKPGEETTQKYTLHLEAYKYEDAGSVVFDIDLPGYKFVVGGVDRRAADRAALGL